MIKSFNPKFLPINISEKDLIDILKLEGEARAKVEKFNSIIERSIIKKELLMMFSLKESIQSTRIEGTQATFSEVIEAGTTGKTNKDINEVMNYFDALSKAETLLMNNPISTRLFLKIHEIILRMEEAKIEVQVNIDKFRTLLGQHQGLQMPRIFLQNHN